MMFKVLVFWVWLVATVKAQRITSLETKTADDDDASMTFGKINIDIFNTVPFVCTIRNLDGDGNDFQKGDINVFENAELDECLLFEVPNHMVPMIQIRHSGLDGWKCEYIRIYFDDFTFVQCNDGQFIDGDDVHTLQDCSLPMKVPVPSQ